MDRAQRSQTFMLGAVVLLVGACSAESPSSGGAETDAGWSVRSDTRSEGSEVSSTPDTCPPGTEARLGGCVGHGADARGSTDDANRTGDPDAPGEQPSAGTIFDGPSMVGRSESAIQEGWGLGLYWKNALVRFGDETLHQHLGDQRILDLSRLEARVGDRNFAARLPRRPDKKLHFHRNYCDEAGSQTCAEAEIDDDTATFALAMVGLHRAPADVSPSKCTWSMIYGKSPCRFGMTVAPSRVILVYAFRQFVTTDFEVFEHLDVGPREVEPGYHIVRKASDSSGARMATLSAFHTDGLITPSTDTTFPELYP